ncbi:PBSX family phage terminase large subunit [Candidatus Dependentiae bacterium]|nr:MAG: PBSX family phage terminase large subunit [Candidatus Dependentiae bacterium]
MNVTFPAKFYPFFNRKARRKIIKGGRGSAKSHSIAKLLIILTSRQKLRVLCCRELQGSIKDSVHKLLCDKIHELGLTKYFHITEHSIKSWTGSEFIFKGLRNNYNEIKSLEGIDICWLEEGEGVTQESLDVLIPTIRKPGSEIWVSFNPETEKSPCNMTFVINAAPDDLIIEMNWRDNPWFPEVLRKEKDWCKLTDPEKYDWIWEGKYKLYAEDLIFKGKFEVDCEFTGPADVQRFQGLDFGFANDPMSFHQYYIHDECLYIEFEAYGRGVEIDEWESFLDSVPNARKWKITADSERPDGISHLANRGFHIEGAKKGAGSVEDGIAFLKGFRKIYIHSRCKGAKEDFENYRYKRDRVTNQILPIPLDKSNHACDDARYAFEDYSKGSLSIFDVLHP